VAAKLQGITPPAGGWTGATVKAAGRGVSFRPHANWQKFLELLPPQARAEYRRYFIAENGGGADAPLADEVLRAVGTFAAVGHRLEGLWAESGLTACRRYAGLRDSIMYRNLWPSDAWPEWRAGSSIVGPPSETKVKTLFMHLYGLVKGILESSLRSRWPGRSVTVDGTFRLGSRIAGHADCVLTFFIGMDGTIFHWVVTATESWSLLIPCLVGIREQLADADKLQFLRAFTTDT
jgi:hypothetical protein